MIGLLLNDWYVLRKSFVGRFVITLFFMIAGVYLRDVTFFASICFYSILVVTAITVGERRSEWCYLWAAPVSRAQVVSARYLFALLYCLTMILLSTGATAVMLSLKGLLSAPTLLMFVYTLFPCTLIPMSLALLLAFTLGKQKVSLGVFSIFLGTIVFYASDLFINDRIWVIEDPKIGILAVFGSFVFIALSWLTAIFFFRHREL